MPASLKCACCPGHWTPHINEAWVRVCNAIKEGEENFLYVKGYIFSSERILAHKNVITGTGVEPWFKKKFA